MKKIHHILLTVAGLLVLPFSSHATHITGHTPGSGCVTGEFCNPISYTSLSDFLGAVLNVIITIALPIIVLAIIYTGFIFVTAGGNEEKLKKAKQAIVWTLIGAMIILGAFVLSKAISGTVDEIKNASTQTQIIVMNQ